MGYAYSNGTSHTRTHDLDGRVVAINTSHVNGINQSYSYDDASRIGS